MAPVAAADGIVLVDKPSGPTSHDVVDRVRRALSTRRVGHAGTLDPMATGLLIVGVGRATRLLRFLADLPKSYEGEALLGIETTTLDAQGSVVRQDPEAAALVDEPRLRQAAARFVGEIEQAPPAFSAVKVGGRKLYEAARRGERIEAPPRRVTVAAFEITGYAPPRFGFTVRCSSGTYVRSLVADVGAALGCGAHLVRLRRTAIGPFEVGEALPPDEPGTPRPPQDAVRHLPALVLDERRAEVAAHGGVLPAAGIAGPYRVLAPGGELIGIYRDDGHRAAAEVILAPA